MNNMTEKFRGSGLAFSRRTMLKVAGASTAGAGLFSGMASANSLNEIHFCGCSQVCVDSNGFGFVIFAWETEDDGWEYMARSFSQLTGKNISINERVKFCYTVDEFIEDYDVGGKEHKIIAVRQDGCNICNPGQCASKALSPDNLKSISLPGSGKTDWEGCDTDGFGSYTCNGNMVEVVQANCGLYDEDGEERNGGPPEERGRSGK